MFSRNTLIIMINVNKHTLVFKNKGGTHPIAAPSEHKTLSQLWVNIVDDYPAIIMPALDHCCAGQTGLNGLFTHVISAQVNPPPK